MSSITIRPISELKLTNHASVRQQQRGILAGVIDAVLTFGDMYRAGDGCVAYFLGDQATRRHGTRLRSIADRAHNVAVVLSSDGAIVTVQHVARPKRRWRAL